MGQNMFRSFHNDDACILRVNVPEVISNRVPGNFRQRAGKFHPSRTSTNNHEGHHLLTNHWIPFAFRCLKCKKNFASDRGRVLECFQARCERSPILMTEITVGRTSGNHQMVIGQRAIRQNQTLLIQVKVKYLCHQNFTIGLTPKDRSKRRGNIRRR